MIRLPKKNIGYFFNKIYNNPYISLTKYIEMQKEYLGEFEELVLTMVGILQEDAYGNAIVTEIKERVGREVNLSAVHVTLYRLEDKGYVKSGMGGATNSRGGRRKRIFTITNAGLAMLRARKEQQMELWKLLPQLKIVSGY
jgi:DNA-binding PadR family transcriptional regulator